VLLRNQNPCKLMVFILIVNLVHTAHGQIHPNKISAAEIAALNIKSITESYDYIKYTDFYNQDGLIVSSTRKITGEENYSYLYILNQQFQVTLQSAIQGLHLDTVTNITKEFVIVGMNDSIVKGYEIINTSTQFKNHSTFRRDSLWHIYTLTAHYKSHSTQQIFTTDIATDSFSYSFDTTYFNEAGVTIKSVLTERKYYKTDTTFQFSGLSPTSIWLYDSLGNVINYSNANIETRFFYSSNGAYFGFQTDKKNAVAEDVFIYREEISIGSDKLQIKFVYRYNPLKYESAYYIKNKFNNKGLLKSTTTFPTKEVYHKKSQTSTFKKDGKKRKIKYSYCYYK
jgi:hypothetical protein